jgi:Domain of unknown function (DUF4397)
MSVRRCVVGGAVASLVALTGPVPVSQAAATGAVQVIQAVPHASVRVSIDGKQVRSGVGLGSILGPYSLPAGRHVVRFVDAQGSVSMTAALDVRAGSDNDVVLHRPASIGGKPVVNVYRTPRKPIGPGKARVLVAHTATVAPADVRVDGKVVFQNIANGEFAEADVPAGAHQVELLPTGQTRHPILGPIRVSLAPRTVTMVYAVGTPTNGSMNVIAHATRLASDGTVQPGRITTGSAGLAAAAHVTTFTTPTQPTDHRGVLPAWLWAPAAAALVLLGTRSLMGRYADPARASTGG